jgi:genome maintenance exonuclease 1
VEADKILAQAGDRGTIVHGLIEDYLVGQEIPCPDGVQGFWDSISPALVNVSNIQLIEGAVWHPSGFAGSVDCVASWKGQPAIVDWKSNSKPKKSEWITDYFQQISAYCAAVNRVYGLNRAVVVALEHSPAQVFEKTRVELIEHWRNF